MEVVDELKDMLDARGTVKIGLGVEPIFKVNRIQSTDVINEPIKIEDKRMLYSAVAFSMLGAFTKD